MPNSIKTPTMRQELYRKAYASIHPCLCAIARNLFHIMTHSGTARGILRRTNASAHANPPCVTHARVARLPLPMTLAHLSTPLLGVADAAIIGRLGQAHLLGAIAAAAM